MPCLLHMLCSLDYEAAMVPHFTPMPRRSIYRCMRWVCLWAHLEPPQTLWFPALSITNFGCSARSVHSHHACRLMVQLHVRLSTEVWFISSTGLVRNSTSHCRPDTFLLSGPMLLRYTDGCNFLRIFTDRSTLTVTFNVAYPTFYSVAMSSRYATLKRPSSTCVATKLCEFNRCPQTA